MRGLLAVVATIVVDLSFAAVGGTIPHAKQPFERFKRQIEDTPANSSASSLQVDLGYEIYEGFNDETSGLNQWRGIRFVAPPIGELRWQPPQPPAYNRSNIIQASNFGSECPQSSANAISRIFPSHLGNEDCLFLNVYSPPDAANLPVLVWIHGGGYGLGNGSAQNLASIINANNNSFVGVAIQYRLGAFGFLASDEVARNGVANAGILDAEFALEWVQAYIHLFGGNTSQVTISGESAGAGAVMLLDMAYGGTLGTSLFQNSIAASPYLPMQYGYKDWVPSQSYYAFAAAAGCFSSTRYGANSSQTIFDCLVAQDTETLQYASFNVSETGTYGTWGFLPVTDGVLIQDLPSRQLLEKRVNGANILVGNNADEGPLFVPQDIMSIEDLVEWLQFTFPLFSNNDIAKVLLYYPSGNETTEDEDALRYATAGDMGATAINVSSVAAGQQQRANNIYAETSFVCPSYWLAEAYSGSGSGVSRSSYRYQYSVPVALHGVDVAVYFGPAPPTVGPDMSMAFMRIWGSFITQDNPSIPNEVANGASSNNTAASNPASSWPEYSVYAPYQINLNQTGGTPLEVALLGVVNVTEFVGPGQVNDIELVNAYTWEGGRGVRCDFWRSVGGLVPE